VQPLTPFVAIVLFGIHGLPLFKLPLLGRRVV